MSKFKFVTIMKKKILSLALLALVTSAPAMAQDEKDNVKDYQVAPHQFITIQGGVQNTFNNEFNNWKTFTPTASVSYGAFFTPVVGARLHVNGAWNKSGVDYVIDTPDGHYNYNYLTGSADVLVNLCTLFGKKDWYPVNLIFIGGLGANYAWEGQGRCEKAALPYTNLLHSDNDSRWAFNGRVGLMLDVPVHKNISINLEGDLNTIAPGKDNCFNSDHLQMTAQVGVSFKFGYRKPKAEPEPEPEPEIIAEPEPKYETRIDTIWYDDVTYKDVTADREIKKEIFFGIKEAGVNQDQAQIKAVADFLKGVKNGEVTITSYADKGTGTPAANMKYSKKRAENTKKALIEHGVDASIFKSVEWKGDTVQPYDENDKNRLSVITGHGIYTEKEKVVTKKFRTKETRVRVN